MARIDDLMEAALKSAGDKPPDTAAAPTKKAYSEKISSTVAGAVANELRERGLNPHFPSDRFARCLIGTILL